MAQLRNSSLVKTETEAYPSTLKNAKQKNDKTQGTKNRMDDKNYFKSLLCRKLYITVYHWFKKGKIPSLSKKKVDVTCVCPSLRFFQLKVTPKCKEADPGGTGTL